jgi:hypothetical protein
MDQEEAAHPVAGQRCVGVQVSSVAQRAQRQPGCPVAWERLQALQQQLFALRFLVTAMQRVTTSSSASSVNAKACKRSAQPSRWHVCGTRNGHSGTSDRQLRGSRLHSGARLGGTCLFVQGHAGIAGKGPPAALWPPAAQNPAPAAPRHATSR